MKRYLQLSAITACDTDPRAASMHVRRLGLHTRAFISPSAPPVMHAHGPIARIHSIDADPQVYTARGGISDSRAPFGIMAHGAPFRHTLLAGGPARRRPKGATRIETL